MTRQELLNNVTHKPMTMGCCEECKGKQKKDCYPNPLDCTDFLIVNGRDLDKIFKSTKRVSLD